jgi:hypothetical protein
MSCRGLQIYCAHVGICMLNKPKMDYKRQTTVLSVSLVLVGMMVLVPAINEKALATIKAKRQAIAILKGPLISACLHVMRPPAHPLG